MRPALLITCFVLLSVRASAQEPADLPACQYNDTVGTASRVVLAGGVVVELRRLDGFDPDEAECHLRVTDNMGRVVFQRGGFNARVMPATGNDLDGDGVADAVFSVDTGGGNRCCWDTTVVSLAPPPRVRAESEAPLGWQFDAARKRFVAEEVIPFYDLGPDMASSPTAVRFYRIGAAGFEDVTRDYCPQLLDPRASGGFARVDEWRALSPERRRAARDRTGDRFENERTGLEGISIALQYFVCGRPADAESLLADVFPGAGGAEMRQRVAASVASYRPK
jgi:hypothetical protein